MSDNEKDPRRPGPSPERLNLDSDNWKDALRRALEKVRPPEGWPDKDADDENDDATR